jgi:hypothetical protein
LAVDIGEGFVAAKTLMVIAAYVAMADTAILWRKRRGKKSSSKAKHYHPSSSYIRYVFADTRLRECALYKMSVLHINKI